MENLKSKPAGQLPEILHFMQEKGTNLYFWGGDQIANFQLFQLKILFLPVKSPNQADIVNQVLGQESNNPHD